MLFLLLKIYTTLHVIITDKNQSPINSMERFQSCSERWLYDRLITCTRNVSYRDCLFSNMKTVLDYVRIQENVHDSQTSVSAIKYLISIYVLANTETGSFQYEMLELKSIFDRDLIFHCNVLSQYTMKDISESIHKYFGCDYKYLYRINRSFGYVSMFIYNHIYEMYKLQVKQNRLNCRESYYFQEYYKLIGNKKIKKPAWSSDAEKGEIKTFHCALADIINGNLNEIEIEKRLLDHKSETVHVHFYFSIGEIYHALEDYKVKLSKFYPGILHDPNTNDIFAYDLNIKNLKKKISNAQKMSNNLIFSRYARDITLYEEYHYYVSLGYRSFKYIRWIRKYKLYNKCVIASKKFYKDIWVGSKKQLKSQK